MSNKSVRNESFPDWNGLTRKKGRQSRCCGKELGAQSTSLEERQLNGTCYRDMGTEGRKEVMGAAMHDGNHACTATAGAEAMLSNSRELAFSVVS